jgi:transposase
MADDDEPGGERQTPARQVRTPTRARVAQVLTMTRQQWGLAPEAPVWSCYEAGRDGFWPHRLLTSLGVTNLVVDSSSIEVPRRVRRAKTDRLDGGSLLRLLCRSVGGERDCWHVVRVPCAAVEAARHDSRALTTLQQERTRYRNRIHSLLALHGVRLVIDARLPARLAEARDWAGDPLSPAVQARVLETWRLLQAVETERATRRLDELFSRGLRNRRQVGALCGLVSAPYQSGQRPVDQGLMRSGVPAVRRLAVEVAWLWVQYQPTSALTRWYREKFGGGRAGVRRAGIVALGRRVMIALWHYVDHGVVPAGAQLKA